MVESEPPDRATSARREPAPRGRRRRRAALVSLVLLAVAVVAGGLLVTTGPLAPGGHGGEEVAEPSTDVVADGLDAATSEIHAHLNWLVWGPSDARPHPEFPRLVDAAIEEAEERSEQEIARLLREARDAAVRDDELLEAHGLVEDAETLAHGGEVDDGELYVDEPDPDDVEDTG